VSIGRTDTCTIGGAASGAVILPILVAAPYVESAVTATMVFYAENPQMIPPTVMTIKAITGMSSGFPPSGSNPVENAIWIANQVSK
jgi:hypothetical protein